MEDLKINQDVMASSGTSLQDFITISFQELVDKLGEPMVGSDKDQVEWVLQRGDVVATIYDYSVHDGYASQSVRSITHWHVGGFNKHAVELVREVLGINK